MAKNQWFLGTFWDPFFDPFWHRWRVIRGIFGPEGSKRGSKSDHFRGHFWPKNGQKMGHFRDFLRRLVLMFYAFKMGPKSDTKNEWFLALFWPLFQPPDGSWPGGPLPDIPPEAPWHIWVQWVPTGQGGSGGVKKGCQKWSFLVLKKGSRTPFFWFLRPDAFRAIFGCPPFGIKYRGFRFVPTNFGSFSLLWLLWIWPNFAWRSVWVFISQKVRFSKKWHNSDFRVLGPDFVEKSYKRTWLDWFRSKTVISVSVFPVLLIFAHFCCFSPFFAFFRFFRLFCCFLVHFGSPPISWDCWSEQWFPAISVLPVLTVLFKPLACSFEIYEVFHFCP